ncbi:hypothetical protein Poly51_45980 [Rubripirellula tenax]|uniref:Uncharacterized protein n=1 Tax=Rubripirellula tenax TaxID=2528015 RepID=A0A5C6EKR5_9BACT|nr:hypothetical protein [Rubripirellula tenax]TWU48697.1 hypothetical protein Poly51_45980 [Rubripirellula tenax]
MNSPPSHRESSRDQARQRFLTPTTTTAMWWLRWVVLIQCIGVVGRYLLSSVETESDIYGWLYFDLHWPESLCQGIDDFGMVLTLVAAVVIGVAGWCRSKCDPVSIVASIAHWSDQVALVWVAVWMLALSLAHMIRASVYGELALAEHAVRYAAPIALLMLSWRPVSMGHPVGEPSSLLKKGSDPLRRFEFTMLQQRLQRVRPLFQQAASRGRGKMALSVLVLAAAATFLAHGYKAMECYAPFTDLILLSDLQWTGFGFSQSTAERALVAIGVLDAIVAIALVVFRFRIAAAYMAIWGWVTAASRMSALGLDAWPETVLRAANGGVPFVILLLLVAQLAAQQHSAQQNSAQFESE